MLLCGACVWCIVFAGCALSVLILRVLVCVIEMWYAVLFCLSSVVACFVCCSVWCGMCMCCDLPTSVACVCCADVLGVRMCVYVQRCVMRGVFRLVVVCGCVLVGDVRGAWCVVWCFGIW